MDCTARKTPPSKGPERKGLGQERLRDRGYQRADATQYPLGRGIALSEREKVSPSGKGEGDRNKKKSLEGKRRTRDLSLSTTEQILCP